jgi:phosphoglycolate phosphatase
VTATCGPQPSAFFFDTFLFDLDGTLIDSVADLATAVNLLRGDLDLAPLDIPTVRGHVGDGATMLVRRSLPERAFAPPLLQRFLDYYEEHLLEKTTIYPGIVEFLERHRRKRMAVVTNKPYRHSMELLRGLGLLDYFGSVVGGESCPEKKPHPAPVLRALAELGSTPQRAVMIGDHHTDLLAGSAAGVATCFCSWGLGEDGGFLSTYRAAIPHDLFRLFPDEPL